MMPCSLGSDVLQHSNTILSDIYWKGMTYLYCIVLQMRSIVISDMESDSMSEQYTKVIEEED